MEEINDRLEKLYHQIERLRNSGVKMKDIADMGELAPSVLSSLYSTVLPAYFREAERKSCDEALDKALLLVNNISKRRLLSVLPDLLYKLENWQPAVRFEQTDTPFVAQLKEREQTSIHQIASICGLYESYSLSSSSASLKKEPFIIRLSDDQRHIQVGRLSAYGDVQWGMGVSGDPQNFYCMFSEAPAPHFIPVTVYLQIPFFHHPKQLRGLYMGLDYNRNPIARRILLVKESDHTDLETFMQMERGLISPSDLTEEQEAYYRYACQAGDYIKMCTVPSLQMDETDLIKEKRMLEL